MILCTLKKKEYIKSLNIHQIYGRPISIIDPETTEEIKPKVYLDKNTNELKGKCELKPYKSYFAFEIREKKEDV